MECSEFFNISEDREERYTKALNKLLECKDEYDKASTWPNPDKCDITDKMMLKCALEACCAEYLAASLNMHMHEIWLKLNILNDFEREVIEAAFREVSWNDCADKFLDLCRGSKDYMEIAYFYKNNKDKNTKDDDE